MFIFCLADMSSDEEDFPLLEMQRLIRQTEEVRKQKKMQKQSSAIQEEFPILEMQRLVKQTEEARNKKRIQKQKSAIQPTNFGV